jgi:hypothetical protein
VRYFHYNDLGTVVAQTKAADSGGNVAIENAWMRPPTRLRNTHVRIVPNRIVSVPGFPYCFYRQAAGENDRGFAAMGGIGARRLPPTFFVGPLQGPVGMDGEPRVSVGHPGLFMCDPVGVGRSGGRRLRGRRKRGAILLGAEDCRWGGSAPGGRLPHSLLAPFRDRSGWTVNPGFPLVTRGYSCATPLGSEEEERIPSADGRRGGRPLRGAEFRGRLRLFIA